MRRISLTVVVMAMACQAGCSPPAASKLSYAVTRIESIPRAAVLAAAETAMQEHFRISETDPVAGLIRSQPVETTETQQSGRLGDMLGAPRRIRRVAEIRVEEVDNGFKVFCKVLVQQSESDEQHLFGREHATTDLPTDTPAQRDAATTREQNAAWRTRGRDRALERQILQAVHEHAESSPTS